MKKFAFERPVAHFGTIDRNMTYFTRLKTAASYKTDK